MSEFILKSRDILNAAHITPSRLTQYRNGYQSQSGAYEYPPLLQQDEDWTWINGNIYYTKGALQKIHKYRDNLKEGKYEL